MQSVDMRPAVRAALRFFRRLWAEYQHDKCAMRASGLAFATLLALVPLSAFMFSLFSAFGAMGDLVADVQAFVIRLLVPTRQEQIIDYIQLFVANTQTLGVVGLLFFLATSVLLLAAIQSNFDAVWGSHTGPSSLKRLATYASVLIVGGFLMGVGLNLTGALRSIVPEPQLGGRFSMLLGTLPPIVLFVALFFMIEFIPTSHIRPSRALIGALVGAALWEITRRLFLFWATYVIRLSVIYGSIAVIPIFLIWLYLAWSIVLLSLEITYVLQYHGGPSETASHQSLNLSTRLLAGIGIYFAVAQRFLKGQPPPKRSELSMELGMPLSEVAFYTEAFEKSGLLIPAGHNGRGLVPSRSLDRISMQEMMRCLFGPAKNGDPSNDAAETALETIRNAANNAFAQVTVIDYLEPARSQLTRTRTQAGNAQGPSRPTTVRRRVAARLTGAWRRFLASVDHSADS